MLEFPGMPKELKMIVISASSLELSWTFDLEDKLSVTFAVTYCKNTSRSTCTVVNDIQSQTLLMPDLAIFTWYWVSVCAENGFGQSRTCGQGIASTPRRSFTFFLLSVLTNTRAYPLFTHQNQLVQYSFLHPTLS